MHTAAVLALELEDNLLGHLDLLAEHGLGLTTESSLLAVVTTATLGARRRLAGLVLRHGVRRVLLALFAVRALRLREVDLNTKCASAERSTHNQVQKRTNTAEGERNE